MKYNRLGNSDLTVSEVCLGTMTWGMQNSEEEAHEQLDCAIKRGVNFIDTAEMYPIPTTHPAHRAGRTEQFIGTYLHKHRHTDLRSKLVIATKVMGYCKKSRFVGFRYDPPRLDRPYADSRQDAQSLVDACAGSLRRLQTEYIDLFQLHWPDRYVPSFGSREYCAERGRDGDIPIRDILVTIKELLRQGKIRAYGLSNETTFGVCQFVRYADELGMARPASIQNSFSLLDRQFEGELAEACSPRNYDIALMPWSILAGGMLTGKYHGKMTQERKVVDDSLDECRFVKFPKYQDRLTSTAAFNATAEYMRIADEASLPVCVLAQSFCKSRWFIPSCIVGATCLEQLEQNMDAFDVDLPQHVLQKIDLVHGKNRDCIWSV